MKHGNGGKREIESKTGPRITHTSSGNEGKIKGRAVPFSSHLECVRASRVEGGTKKSVRWDFRFQGVRGYAGKSKHYIQSKRKKKVKE